MTSALPKGASRRIHGGLTSSLLILGLSLPVVARAADEASVLRARAATLASRGDCASALPLIDQARALDPAGDGASALMAGRCLIDMKRFAEAKPVLETAVAHDPSSGDARLALGVAKYHLGERDAARADLEQAQQMLPNNPEAELYLGLILLEREQTADAVTRLDRSRNLQGDTFEPAANYYAALAHAEAGDRKDAEESLRRVQEMAPGTVWAERAGEALEQAEARRVAAPSHWLTIQAGLDYDTNIALRSGAISKPSNISHKDDGKAWWSVDGGVDLFRTNGWGGGVGANYSGIQPFREGNFDQHYLSTSMWLDRELGKKTLLRISPEAGYGWYDGHDFVRYMAVRPELRHDFGKAGLGTAYVRYAYNDFLYDELQTNPQYIREGRDRDGHEILAGYDHQAAATDSLTLRGGGFFHDYRSEGQDYDFIGGGGWLGFRQMLPARFIFDATGSLEYDKYDERSSFAPPPEIVGDRRDYVVAVSSVLTRPINKWLSLSARYQYLDNESNTRVFDYTRHIVGGFVTVSLLP
jgi:tetratricopeptide (TPR) repeat protein